MTREDDLDDAGRAALAAVHDAWKRDVFFPARKSGGFAQDCIVCGDIYWDLEIAVAPDGRVTDIVRVHAAIDCWSKSDAEKAALERIALDGIRTLAFPPPLRGITIACRFGVVTKC